MNALEGNKSTMVPPAGTSFSAAIVSGDGGAGARQIPAVDRTSGHQPAVGDRPGAGARSRQSGRARHRRPGGRADLRHAAGEPVGPQHLSSPLVLAPPMPGRNMTPVWVAAAGIGVVAICVAAAVGLASILRGRNS